MPPSPFLLGAALLFWGWMTDRMWIGIAFALLVEAGRYSRIRWTFPEIAFVRAWRLSVLILVITLALVLMEHVDPRAMSRVFSWLPLILLPLQFVQSYGTSPVTGLGTFSLMVRRRRMHAEKFGLPFHEVNFSFSKVYLAAALISSSLGANSNTPAYFPLMVGLIGWGLLSTRAFSWGYLPIVLCLSLIPAGAAAFAGQKGLMALYARLINAGSSGPAASDRVRKTSMGELGQIKQSQEILWRLKPIHGVLPRLIRLSSYQSYSNGDWAYNYFPPDSPNEADDFKPLNEIQNPDNPTDTEDKFVLCFPGARTDLELVKPTLSRFHLVGAIPADTKSLFPLPGGVTSFHGMGLYSDLHINSMGAFRLVSVEAIVDTDVLWSDSLSPERAPWQVALKQPKSGETKLIWPDLEIPANERAAVAEVAEELKLSEGTFDQKIEKLREYFAANYEYTLYNDTPKTKPRDSTLISAFLTKTHKGHCEFFATAATLLLRQAKIPARYASGFADIEFDHERKEALIRGTHAHAWTRAWDESRKLWVDVDMTPADWAGRERPHPVAFQGLRDWFQIQKESFLIWRSKPGRLMLVTICLLSPVAIGLIFIGRKLWLSRQKMEKADAVRRGATVVSTPLSGLEKPARRVLGSRPPGLPLAAWLKGLVQLLDRPELLEEALALHQSMRFDPSAPGPEVQSRLSRLTEELKKIVGNLPKRSV